MGAVEQFVEDICPFLNQRVKVRVIYECSNTPVCQINLAVVVYECLNSDNCCAYKERDERCLVFQYEAGDDYGGG